MEAMNDTAKSVFNMNARECDIRIKQILSDKLILAQIMKGCIEEYADIPVQEIADRYIENEPEVGNVPVGRDETNSSAYRKGNKIAGVNTEDKTETEGSVYYDILFYAAAPSGSGHNRFLINVEAQKNYHPGYPIVKRGEYYCCRSISAQNGVNFEKGHYGDIQKVFSIWICYDAGKDKNTMTGYSIQKRDIIGHVEEPKQNYDLLEVIVLGLGDPAPMQVGTVLHFLDVLFSRTMKVPEILDTMEKEYSIPMTEKFGEGVNNMCNISQGIWDVCYAEIYDKARADARAEVYDKARAEVSAESKAEGRAEGKAEGRAEGKAEGRAEGKLEGALETLKTSILGMRKLHIPDESIADVFHLSMADIARIAST